MVEIIPAILEQETEQIAEKFKKVQGLVEHVQLDVMDDVFVPNVTFNDPKQLSRIPGDVKIELHFMVENPLDVVKAWTKDPRVDRVLLHYEGLEDVKSAIEQVKDLGVEVGIAMNPDTEVSAIEDVIQDIDMVLVMGVPPGFGGQALDDRTIEKIQAVAALDPTVKIEVDGGVTAENIGALAKAGATHIVSGYAIFSKPNTKKAIESLQEKTQ